MSELNKGTCYKKQQHAIVLDKCRTKNSKKVASLKNESDTNCKSCNKILKDIQRRCDMYSLNLILVVLFFHNF